MDRDTYCMKVCGGKCCTLYPVGEEPVRCPRQSADGSCSIYNIRYSSPLLEEKLVQVGEWMNRLGVVRPFVCGHIENIIASNDLPEAVRKVCCYANPDLLEVEEPCVTK